MAVAQALKDFASEIASHEMTAELERSMDAISEGKISKDSVVDESRDVLRRVYDHLQSSETEFADIVWEGIRTDETLGKCPESGHDLIIRRSRKSRKRFVGCSGYPDCRLPIRSRSGGDHSSRYPVRRLRLAGDQGARRQAALDHLHQHGLPEEAGAARGREKAQQEEGVTAHRKRAPGTGEVHHIENRLDLDLQTSVPRLRPRPYARATGYL
jgi:ssDNA-binding Zn-finger/Zn-ribbon topoisomerase 1